MAKLNINEIKNYLPHRYPFLLVDQVLEYEAGKSILAIKNVSSNEDYFNGHFPGQPIMPGVLIIESLAQTAGILYFLTTKVTPDDDNWFFLAGINNARFRKVVVPGDQLQLRVNMVRNKRNLWVFDAKATVGEELACQVELLIIRGAIK
jgi:3-hydroxyacyl-[acyl-carrier-protein] dehydratase